MKEFSPIFEGVEGLRRSTAARHDLVKMLTIGLLSTLCGGHPSGHPSLKAIDLGEGEAGALSVISAGRPAPQASAGVRAARAEYAGRTRQRGRFRIGLSLEKSSAPELLHR